MSGRGVFEIFGALDEATGVVDAVGDGTRSPVVSSSVSLSSPRWLVTFPHKTGTTARDGGDTLNVYCRGELVTARRWGTTHAVCSCGQLIRVVR